MSERRVRVLKGATQFDEHRNSSRVFPVPPEAIAAAKASRERVHRERPEWYVWIEQGCSPLTPDEYAARGGWHAPKASRRNV